MKAWLILAALILATAAARADSLASAELARALLGPGVWSRVLRIENQATTTSYPRRFDALVFEFADRLWLYADGSGTQSLSLSVGQLEHDKADLGPLLLGVSRGFTRFQDVTDRLPRPDPRHPEPAPGEAAAGRLPFGCFINALAGARHLLLGSDPPPGSTCCPTI
jgi:hypothetical protein